MLARVKERVQFVSNGLELAGVLQLPDGLKKGERRAAFLVLHGFGSNKDGGNVVTVSNLLTGLGYATLRFDMRGCGDSQGARGRTICLEQVEDTRAALDYLSRNENVDTRRIGVIGHSFGAAVAVYAAGVDSRIAACVSAGGWGNGVKKFRKQHESPEAWAKFQGMLEEGRRRKARGQTMMVPRYDIVPIRPELRHNLARGILERQGMSEAHAALTADVLVWADLRGMGSHGVMRVPRYVDFIRKGDLNVRPSIRRSHDAPGCVLLDADRAAGPIAMMEGMRAACEKAKSAGIGLALVKSTTHTAALGYYTQTAARDGFAGIALAASLPLMAYHGARAAGVSTAPLSIAVPGEEEPFPLHMASSMISMGALAQARRSGQSLPEGVVLTAQGEATVDAKTASIPLPLGGPKGSGLGFMAECLASLLTANPILAESLEQTPASKRHRQNGLVIAIDVARFVAPEMFRAQVARLTRGLRELPGDEILMPGERGSRRAAQQRDAVSIPDSVYDELKTL